MTTLWLYWETPRGKAGPPPHIVLCRKSVELHGAGHDVKLVTPATLARYLPDYPRRLFKVALEPRGRLDKYLNVGGRRNAAIAVRVDYVRALLLEKYGGFYLDSDIILFGGLERYFDLLDSYDFCIMRRASAGRRFVSNSFYGSRPGGIVISEYINLLRKRLAGSLNYQGNEVGKDMLTPIIDRHPDVVFEIPERETQPIVYENATSSLADRELELDHVLTPGGKMLTLWSDAFRGPPLHDATLDQLYRGDMLISKAFRAAIPEEAFLALKEGSH